MAAGTIRGIDVSNHNGVVDWAAVKAAGIKFAFIKAAEGSTFVDPYYARNIAQARAEGIVVGSYHYFRYDVDPVAQAAHFLTTIGRQQPGDLPPVVDVEKPSDGSGASRGRAADLQNLGIMLRAVEAGTGRNPIIYTYPAIWREQFGNTKQYSDYPLWIANYGVSSPAIPGGWSNYAFWQYSDRGTLPNMKGQLFDLDVFNGDLAALQRLTGGQGLPLPAPTPTPVPAPPVSTQVTLNGRTVYGNIYQFWSQNGGVERFGLPVSDEFSAPLEGQVYRMQFFERDWLVCNNLGMVSVYFAARELFPLIKDKLGYLGG